MGKDIARTLYVAGAALVGGALIWAFAAHPPKESGEWASWVQAVGAIAAIAATGIFVRWQHTLEVERAQKAELSAQTRAQAAILLSLQSLASELTRMNVLTGFQIDAVGNEIIYPDASAEFNAIAALFSQLPIDQIATQGKMNVYLDLRRAASELSMVYAVQPKQGDGFYRRNREQLHKLQKLCSRHAAFLAEEIKSLDRALYEQNEEQIERL
jgi:hypothetical protein